MKYPENGNQKGVLGGRSSILFIDAYGLSGAAAYLSPEREQQRGRVVYNTNDVTEFYLCVLPPTDGVRWDSPEHQLDRCGQENGGDEPAGRRGVQEVLSTPPSLCVFVRHGSAVSTVVHFLFFQTLVQPRRFCPHRCREHPRSHSLSITPAHSRLFCNTLLPDGISAFE